MTSLVVLNSFKTEERDTRSLLVFAPLAALEFMVFWFAPVLLVPACRLALAYLMTRIVH